MSKLSEGLGIKVTARHRNKEFLSVTKPGIGSHTWKQIVSTFIKHSLQEINITKLFPPKLAYFFNQCIIVNQLAVFKQHYFLLLFWRPLNIKYVQKVRIDVSKTKKGLQLVSGWFHHLFLQIPHYTKSQLKIDKTDWEIKCFPALATTTNRSKKPGSRGAHVGYAEVGRKWSLVQKQPSSGLLDGILSDSVKQGSPGRW